MKKTHNAKLTQFAVLSFAFCVLSLSQVLAGALEDAQQRYQQGLAYERLGRYNEAYTELQLANSLNPQDAQIALALGLVANRLGNHEVAQRALEQSITIDANSAASYFQLALLYEKQGANDRALEAWHRFATLNQDARLREIAQKHIRYLESR